MDAIQIFLEKIKDTKFEADVDKIALVNGNECNLGYYKLAVSVKEMKTFVDTGKKPHRSWKISEIKKYYGLKGSKVAVLEGLLIYEEVIKFCESTIKDLSEEKQTSK